MNIAKKYIIVSIVILIVAVLTLPAYYVLNKLSYQYQVNESYAQKIKQDLQLIPGFFGENMLYSIGWENVRESDIMWGDKLVRLYSEDVRDKDNPSNGYSKKSIQISKDQGETWDNFFVFDDLETTFCDVAIVHNDKIICILSHVSLGFNLLVFDKDAKYTNKIISKSGMPGKEILSAYTKDNKLFLVWSDQRARFPYPDIIDPARGPYLIMAGELNLDTLEFKEHIIGYDVYDLKELFDKQVLNSIINNMHGSNISKNQQVIDQPEPGVAITETESGGRTVNIDTSKISSDESEWSVIERYLKK